MLVAKAYSIPCRHFVNTANAVVSDSFEHLAEVGAAFVGTVCAPSSRLQVCMDDVHRCWISAPS
jgi:hypothetical protein